MNCDNNHRNEEFIVTFDKGNKQDNSRRKHCITNNKSASGIVTHDYDADYICGCGEIMCPGCGHDL